MTGYPSREWLQIYLWPKDLCSITPAGGPSSRDPTPGPTWVRCSLDLNSLKLHFVLGLSWDVCFLWVLARCSSAFYTLLLINSIFCSCSVFLTLMEWSGVDMPTFFSCLQQLKSRARSRGFSSWPGPCSWWCSMPTQSTIQHSSLKPP